MARVLAVALAALVLAGSALAAGNPPKLHGSLAPPSPRLKAAEVKRIFLQNGKVADWLRHYPRGRQVDADFAKATKLWTIKVWAGPAGEVATGKVDDTSGAVTEAWTGPQVAWKMARGYSGAFGGRQINSAPVWLGFCLLFLLGLGDLRRPLQPAQPRPARPALVHRLALVLQPRRHLHERAAGLPAAPLPARPHGLEHVARAARHRRGARSGRSGCSRPRPSSRPASGSGSTCAHRT